MVNPDTLGRKTLESQIVAVTVYGHQALVTRRGVISLTGAEQELVITPLPVTLEVDSVRARGKGTVGVRLLGVSSDRIYTTEPVGERVAELTKQIQELEAERRNLQAQIDALALQSDFIVGLREKTQEPFAQSLSRKNLGLSETLDFLNFLGSQYSEYAIACGDCKTQQQEIDKQLQSLQATLKRVKTPRTKESISVIVGVEVAGEGEFELEISYLVRRATWNPLYDLRVDTSRNILHLSYLAEITQNTGENWPDIALTLSTAKTGTGALPPKLQPWYIDKLSIHDDSLRGRGYSFAAASSPSPPPEEEENSAEAFADLDAMLDEMTEAVMSTSQISQQGNIVTFKLNHKADIPSNNSPHKTNILYDDYPCKLEYVAMPKLVSFAYLQANIKNRPDGATFLPGTANIFRDDVFVGKTQLENIAPGQEFKLNLGIDESLKIERELVERQVDKKFMGNQRKITFAYRLFITNLINQPANLKLTDQLPVSRNEKIKVKLIRINPQISLGEMNILEWDLTIPAEGKQEIYYQFTVEYPPELQIVGLDI
ncbi:MAG TPA: mucoidy inhibitor MuiA family protein [Nostocaceae cyanobacterium]|nr:mucoidy inhibitor MuiA family protein [Nostocaceae cyanobacterium]